jgi:hypothetical protein
LFENGQVQANSIKILLISLLFINVNYCIGQSKTDSISLIKPHHLIIGEAAFYGASMYALGQAWYADYPKSDFHWFNDNNGWLQMDKIGHSYATYQIAYQNSFLLQKTGMERNKAMWLSTGLSIFAISSIEIYDGLSAKWGASYGDLIANTSGGLLYLLQEKYWHEQRIRLKFSYKPSPYAKLRPDVMGFEYPEKLLKDYNAQAYWLSINLKNTFRLNNLPPWLAIAIGYSASGMVGGDENPEEYQHIERYRQFFISPDIDWQKIKTKRKSIKLVFRALNMIKVPLPAISYEKGKIVGHWYR